jgi:hypothetical protein
MLVRATRKQRELLGTKIALEVAGDIHKEFPKAQIQVFGNDNEWRAKLQIRYETVRVEVIMKDGDMTVVQKGAPKGAFGWSGPINEPQQIDPTMWTIPLSDPQVIEKAASYTIGLLRK